MPIVVTCQCGEQFTAADEHAGMAAQCPSCGAGFTIPGASPRLPATPPPPQSKPQHKRGIGWLFGGFLVTLCIGALVVVAFVGYFVLRGESGRTDPRTANETTSEHAKTPNSDGSISIEDDSGPSVQSFEVAKKWIRTQIAPIHGVTEQRNELRTKKVVAEATDALKKELLNERVTWALPFSHATSNYVTVEQMFPDPALAIWLKPSNELNFTIGDDIPRVSAELLQDGDSLTVAATVTDIRVSPPSNFQSCVTVEIYLTDTRVIKPGPLPQAQQRGIQDSTSKARKIGGETEEERYQQHIKNGNDALTDERYEDAAEQFKVASRIFPDRQEPKDLARFANFHQFLREGGSALSDDDFERAVAAYKNAVALNPDDADAIEKLAVAKSRLQASRIGDEPDDDPKPDNVPVKTRLVVARGFDGRSAASRAEAVRLGGGDTGSEAAVENGIIWLANHQNRDGSWSWGYTIGDRCSGYADPGDKKSKMGATGLALLAFLGAGYTHQEGKYTDAVRSGLKFLVGNMIVIKGQSGRLFEPDGQAHEHMYCHGIASCAIIEAFGMTRDDSLREPAQLAINYIMLAQHPEVGGWLYTPGAGGDTSVTSWQIAALRSAELAGMNLSARVKPLATKWFDSVQWQSPGGGDRIGAFYGYRRPLDRPEASATTAIGAHARIFLGIDKRHGALRKSTETIVAQGPSSGDVYYNYHATVAIYEIDGPRGNLWKTWNTSMREVLTKSQRTNSSDSGSWYFGGNEGGKAGGRVYCTAMATMILEAYYRYHYVREIAEIERPADGQLPVPGQEAQAEAEVEIRETFHKEFGETSPADRITLARQLIKLGHEERDVTIRYVLFRLAKGLATVAGDLPLAFAAVDQMSGEYEIDALLAKAEILNDSQQAATGARNQRKISEFALHLCGYAIRSERYELALEIDATAEVAANQAEDAGFVATVARHRKCIEELKHAYDKYLEAQNTLTAMPDDAEAHRFAGRYLCFVREQWEEGLQHLLRCGIPELAALAEKELAPPKSGDDQQDVADAWHAIAKTTQNSYRGWCLKRADYWYRLAEPNLAGFSAVRVKKRIEEIRQQLEKDRCPPQMEGNDAVMPPTIGQAVGRKNKDEAVPRGIVGIWTSYSGTVYRIVMDGDDRFTMTMVSSGHMLGGDAVLKPSSNQKDKYVGELHMVFKSDPGKYRRSTPIHMTIIDGNRLRVNTDLIRWDNRGREISRESKTYVWTRRTLPNDLPADVGVAGGFGGGGFDEGGFGVGGGAFENPPGGKAPEENPKSEF